jgi:NADH:ubiquinone oxidoreductase subunit
VNLPVTRVPRCTSSNAKTLELQLLNVAASCVPPDWARIVHHWADELPIHQNSVPDGEAASPV